MIERCAPGKLFVAGEYTVTEPGTEALLVAVDRFVSVTATAGCGADRTVTVESDIDGGTAACFVSGYGGQLVAADPRPADDMGPVRVALGVVQQLVHEMRLATPPLELRITSELHRAGVKFGLGSSAAVMVAVIDAASAYYGLQLSRPDRFRLGLLASARLNPRSSGGDIAASTWGGWLAYRAPDRTALLEEYTRRGVLHMLAADCPGLSVQPLPSPSGVAVEVGWSGTPASSNSAISRLDSARAGSVDQWHDLVGRHHDIVRDCVDAIENGDRIALFAGVERSGELLRTLDTLLRTSVFTPRLSSLCEIADALGGVAKPSGAGGGDCGIALFDADTGPDTAELHARWKAAGIEPLALRIAVHPEGDEGR
ncbi:phosphomevalonate kinase [Nocardia sp. NPDC005825]|uniref:phosphomevalonate kinase n=1 Tax=unclassified Nocardia TaxID=2637762 RepID=UPI0033EE67BF